MKPDRYIDELIQPIINLYNQMEYELIIEIAKRFDDYDGVTGALEYQLKKLQELGGLNADAVKIIDKYSEKSRTEIMRILKEAEFLNIDIAELTEAFESGVIAVNPDILEKSPALAATLDSSFNDIANRYKKIETTALQSVRGAYLNTLNKAYLDVASGTYDYNTAITKAVREMAKNGIEGATYWRGNVAVHYSIEGTVRRDTLTAVHQCANDALLKSAVEMDCTDVEVSQHIGARVSNKSKIANHFGWQGKVYSIYDGTHWAFELKGNTELEKETGYGDIEGLGGVNCRHRMFLFFKGISKPKKLLYNEKENKKVYEATQTQRRMERQIRSLKKEKATLEVINTPEAIKQSTILQAKLNKKYDEINAFCKANNLKRDYSRERVSEQL